LIIPFDRDILAPQYAMVTKTLVVVNTIIFVLFTNEEVYSYFQLTSNSGFSYRLITHQFLHGNFMHLLGNMVFLLPFGAIMEEKVGRAKALIFYLVGGIVAGVIWLYFSDDKSALVGASGSISAMTSACFVLRPKLQLTGLLWLFIFIRFFTLPVWVWALVFFVKDFIFNFLDVGSQTAYDAHIGGFVGNFILCILAIKLGFVRSASSDLLGSFGIRVKAREESSKNKLKSEMGFRDISTVDHVMNDLQSGDVTYDLDKLMILSKRSVTHGHPKEGYQILQTWLEKNNAHKKSAEVAYEIALICLRHLNKTDLACSWLEDAMRRNPDAILKENIAMLLESIRE